MKINKETLLMGGVAIAGVIIFLYWLSPTMMADIKYGITKLFNPNAPDPLEVPWGGGTQQTEAGTRYLAGPDDLPPA